MQSRLSRFTLPTIALRVVGMGASLSTATPKERP
jgi:hypothetical protein